MNLTLDPDTHSHPWESRQVGADLLSEDVLSLLPVDHTGDPEATWPWRQGFGREVCSDQGVPVWPPGIETALLGCVSKQGATSGAVEQSPGQPC